MVSQRIERVGFPRPLAELARDAEPVVRVRTRGGHFAGEVARAVRFPLPVVGKARCVCNGGGRGNEEQEEQRAGLRVVANATIEHERSSVCIRVSERECLADIPQRLELSLEALGYVR